VPVAGRGGGEGGTAGPPRCVRGGSAPEPAAGARSWVLVTTGLRARASAAPDGPGTPADLAGAVMVLLHSFRRSPPLDIPLVAAGVAAFGAWGDLKSGVALLYAASTLPVPSGLSVAAAAAMVSVAAPPAAVAAAAAAAAAGVPERAARRTWRGGSCRRRRCACRRQRLGAAGVYGHRGARLPRQQADCRRCGAAQDEVTGRRSQWRERVNARAVPRAWRRRSLPPTAAAAVPAPPPLCSARPQREPPRDAAPQTRRRRPPPHSPARSRCLPPTWLAARASPKTPMRRCCARRRGADASDLSRVRRLYGGGAGGGDAAAAATVG